LANENVTNSDTNEIDINFKMFFIISSL